MRSGIVTVVIHYQAQPGQGGTARHELAALIDKVVAGEPGQDDTRRDAAAAAL
jgi:hypothetical protein